MSVARKVTRPAWDIEGLDEMEIEVLCAAVAVSSDSRIKKHLHGEGFDVPMQRIGEIVAQLWEDLHEQRLQA
jgi:hypothetical protein